MADEETMTDPEMEDETTEATDAEETAFDEGEEIGDTTADEEGDPDGDDPDEDEAPEEGLPRGVRKRIDTLTAKRRAAERRAEEAEKESERLRKLTGAGDPKAILAVAKRHGILPDLVGADEAKGLVDLGNAESRLSLLRDTLDDLEDSGEGETELGGKTYTAGQLRKLRRQAEREVEELREAYGPIRKTLSARTAKLLRLGLAAEKEAARGKQAPKAKARVSRKPDPEEDETPPARVGVRTRPQGHGAGATGANAKDRLRQFTMDLARRTEHRRE